MKKRWIGLVLCLAFGQVQAASFDCAKAGTKVEKLICANDELSKLDEALAAAYADALKSSDPASLKAEQKAWLKVRNRCADVACIQAAYRQRTEAISQASLSPAPAKTIASDFSPTPRTAHSIPGAIQSAIKKPAFSLIKGKDVPVCEAYLKRLNATEWGDVDKMPTCGRPENDSVEGFTKLNRVSLTVEQIAALYGEVSAFSSQGSRNQDGTHPANAIKGYLSIEDAYRLVDRGSIIAWHYDPPVDIDNNGKVDSDLMIWQGYGHASGVGNIPCGGSFGVMNAVLFQPTVILLVDWQKMKLNAPRTRALFAHPVGGYPVIFHGKQVMSDRFRPIGNEMGIFAYKGQYYFDTFFDAWGDFQGNRRSNSGDGKHRIKNDLGDILGVFHRKDGVTKQVCEFRWNEFEQHYK